jgi:hypothetical protein
MRYKKAMNATFLADRFYVCILWIVAIVYIMLFALYFEDAFSQIHRFVNYLAQHPLRLPFLVVVVMVSYRFILAQGLYAYTEEALISFAYHSIPLADLTIVKANPNWPYFIHTVVKPDAQSKYANKKFAIRTNNSHNFYLLQSLIKAENT